MENQGDNQMQLERAENAPFQRQFQMFLKSDEKNSFVQLLENTIQNQQDQVEVTDTKADLVRVKQEHSQVNEGFNVERNQLPAMEKKLGNQMRDFAFQGELPSIYQKFERKFEKVTFKPVVERRNQDQAKDEELTSLRGQLAETRNQNKAKDEQVGFFHAQLVHTRNQNEAKDEELTFLRAQLNENQAMAEQSVFLCAQLEETRDQDQAKDEELTFLRAQLAETRNQNDTKDEELTSLRDQLAEARNQNQAMVEPLRSFRAQLVETSNQNEAKDEELTFLRAQLKENQAMVEQSVFLRVQLQAKDEELTSLRAQLAETRNQNDTKDEELTSLRDQLAEARNQNQAMVEPLRSFRAQLVETSNQNEAKDEELTFLRAQLKENQAMVEQSVFLRVQLQAKDEELTSLRAQLAETRNQNQAMAERLRSSHAQVLTRRSQNREVQKNEGLDWILKREEIDLMKKKIGDGGWGTVEVGKFRGTEVAVKKIHNLIISDYSRGLFEREMTIASRCRHPCLVQFIGATNDNGCPLFIMELLETDLRALITERNLVDQECLQIAFDTIRALNYLHLSKPAPIIHRDVSSANVLLYRGKDGWRGKLSDFGAANLIHHSKTPYPGASLYSAPEACTNTQNTKKNQLRRRNNEEDLSFEIR
ncbi:uncharacterized protein LOC130645160 isoform X2 [Hydractinia symbiolongicarpus]|uniref:uncharacterized protein LOC130645160 isoform X2 n=1 Tax=Hydractinia symbiolongicarpus TaxID=13093 RepID=UPI00254B2516|nr:uncharacterized protein LOC130645160 isoform X2 [Hydractinia symbiolongicarpus]